MGVTARISSKFQVAIPKEVREEMGWKAGQKLVFVPRGDTLVMAPARDFDSLRGIAKGANTEGYRDREDRY